jgi:hypothetical protein
MARGRPRLTLAVSDGLNLRVPASWETGGPRHSDTPAQHDAKAREADTRTGEVRADPLLLRATSIGVAASVTPLYPSRRFGSRGDRAAKPGARRSPTATLRYCLGSSRSSGRRHHPSSSDRARCLTIELARGSSRAPPECCFLRLQQTDGDVRTPSQRTTSGTPEQLSRSRRLRESVLHPAGPLLQSQAEEQRRPRRQSLPVWTSCDVRWPRRRTAPSVTEQPSRQSWRHCCYRTKGSRANTVIAGYTREREGRWRPDRRQRRAYRQLRDAAGG